ncbi:Mor transcription activator family protein [Comamonadaceae bacterium PP-2]
MLDTNQHSQEDDPMEHLRRQFKAAVQKHSPDIAELLADEIIQCVIKSFGGSYFYVPKRTNAERALMYKRLKAQFDGTNAMALSRASGLSVRQVRRILSRGIYDEKA